MICDNCIHNAVCERAHFENHCGYKHTEADVINPELKIIKAEMIAYRDNDKNDFDFEIGAINSVIAILDKHIKENKE